MLGNNMKTPEEKIAERMDFFRDWSKDSGEESMLKLSCGLIQHLSDRCKEYSKKIAELESK